MVGIINSGNEFSTRDIGSLEPEDALKMAIADIYSSELENLGYSKSQITSAIEKLRSHAPTHYPYLLGAVLYSVLIKLYQQMKVSELKQGLDSIIKRSKSPKLSELFHETLGALDLIIDKNLSWDNPYFWNFHSSDIYILSLT